MKQFRTKTNFFRLITRMK